MHTLNIFCICMYVRVYQILQFHFVYIHTYITEYIVFIYLYEWLPSRAVIRGAAKTLSTRKVKMLTAEVAFSDHEWYNVVKLLDEKFGFDCYLNGKIPYHIHTLLYRCTYIHTYMYIYIHIPFQKKQRENLMYKRENIDVLVYMYACFCFF